MALTPKRKRFIEGYLGEARFNATEAALAAGFSPRTARSQGARLLTFVDIQQALAERMRSVQDTDAMTLEEAVLELSRLARADMGDYAEWGPAGVQLKQSTELPDGDSKAVSEVSQVVTTNGTNVRFKLHDKRAALESIVKIRQWQHEQSAYESRIKALEEAVEELSSRKGGLNGHRQKGYPVGA